jgi:hypothetical protein
MSASSWRPELDLPGMKRIVVLDDVLVLCGAGVGGRFHVPSARVCPHRQQ